jgi:uncharacterized protein YndB with AHSA1/START domain
MTSPSEYQLVTRRELKAPRILVFEAFMDPHHIGLWWGPNGFTTTTISMEPKVGGKWRFTMHGPDGTDYPNVIAYTEISKPERLCYDHGEDDGPPMFKVMVEFDEVDYSTVLTLRHLCSSQEQLDELKKHGAVEGARQTLERLARFISPE